MSIESPHDNNQASATLPKTYKSTDWYLALTSIFYILIGAGFGLSLIFKIVPILAYLGVLAIPLSFAGMYLGLIPIGAARLTLSGFPDGSSQYQWIAPTLGLVALVLGVFALISLVKFKESPKYVKFWYFLMGLSWMMLAGNIIEAIGSSQIFPMIATIFVHPIFMTVFVLRLGRNMRAN